MRKHLISGNKVFVKYQAQGGGFNPKPRPPCVRPWALQLFCLLLTHSWVSSEANSTIVCLVIPINYVLPKLSQKQGSRIVLETTLRISTK